MNCVKQILVPKRGKILFIAEVEIYNENRGGFVRRGRNWKFLWGKGVIPELIWLANYHFFATVAEAVVHIDRLLKIDVAKTKRELQVKERKYNALQTFKQSHLI